MIRCFVNLLSSISIVSIVVSIAALVPSVAFGHPGHGVESEDPGLLHYLFSPAHSFPVLVMLIGTIAAVRWIRRTNRKCDES